MSSVTQHETAESLVARQRELKARYRDNPESARQRLAVSGEVVAEHLACRLDERPGGQLAGLHRGTGGDGSFACSVEILLEALVGCAGTTLAAVARALRVPLRRARVTALGDIDFRGTLAVDRQAPVGLTGIELVVELDTDADPAQVNKLVELTERYCVVYQTLAQPPQITARVVVEPGRE